MLHNSRSGEFGGNGKNITTRDDDPSNEPASFCAVSHSEPVPHVLCAVPPHKNIIHNTHSPPRTPQKNTTRQVISFRRRKVPYFALHRRNFIPPFYSLSAFQIPVCNFSCTATFGRISSPEISSTISSSVFQPKVAAFLRVTLSTFSLPRSAGVWKRRRRDFSCQNVQCTFTIGLSIGASSSAGT